MHDLLSFMPRPRMNHTPLADLRRTVADLIDDIQVLAAADQVVALHMLALFAHEERTRLRELDTTDTAAPSSGTGDLR